MNMEPTSSTKRLGALLLLAFFLMPAASAAADKNEKPKKETKAGRIYARPSATGSGECAPGESVLKNPKGRNGVLLIPSAAKSKKPLPMVLLLHGAGGGDGARVIRILREHAEREGFIIVAPSSRGGTWDAIRGGFGYDVDDLNRQLTEVFSRCAVDAKKLAVGGFSDGASYALSLGLTNGDLFTHIIAFSPGFMVPSTLRGFPLVFDSHGKSDSILPIDSCSRRIVPWLKKNDYQVEYIEFEGDHEVPPAIREAAVKWFLGK